MPPSPKAHHESFTRFFENPTRESFRDLIQFTTGESRHCEFKSEWPEKPALAKHILAIANSGGGAIIVGVSENADNSLSPTGLTILKDKSKIFDGIKKFMPESLLRSVVPLDFNYTASEYAAIEGKRFQVLLIESDMANAPYISAAGSTGIDIDTIYFRRDGASIKANYDALQLILAERFKAEKIRTVRAHYAIKNFRGLNSRKHIRNFGQKRI